MNTARNGSIMEQPQQTAFWDIPEARRSAATHSYRHEFHKSTLSPKGISLFSGAGGMDVGFTRAGIDVALANELAPHACDTYEKNHPGTQMLRGDLNEHIDKFSEGAADIVFGGSPCQGFSVAGKMDPDDERSELIWSFLEVVGRVRPKVFVMENVKALGALEKWRPIRSRFLELANDKGYCCHYFVLNAADFGVSQNRERVFFVGSLKEYDPTCFMEELDKYKEAQCPCASCFHRSRPQAVR